MKIHRWLFYTFLCALLPTISWAQIDANLENQMQEAHISPRALKLLEAKMAHDHYNKDFAAVVDYSLPSNQPRFFLINLKDKTIQTFHVAHGWNSGGENAVCFSNRDGSFQSSLGFVKTVAPANGAWRPSVTLKGLSASNSNMEKRHIILHSADYSSEDFLRRKGYWGRSQGCLAMPQEDIQFVIKSLGNNALILNYHDKLWDQSQANPDKPACLPNADPHDIPPSPWEVEENKVGSAFKSERGRFQTSPAKPAAEMGRQ